MKRKREDGEITLAEALEYDEGLRGMSGDDGDAVLDPPFWGASLVVAMKIEDQRTARFPAIFDRKER